MIVVKEINRLAFYARRTSSDFWDDHWTDKIRDDLYEKAEKGFLGDFEEPFLKYLPKHGPILEAGCGLGRYVLALNKRGYKCEGIDYASETIKIIKRFQPDLPVREGDVTCIEVEDGHYAGYISLGVIEHRRDGPEPFLVEANRVLKPNGIAYISVPYFNGLRILKAKMGLYETEAPDGTFFYQYAFMAEEMRDLLNSFGFEILATHGYASWKSIKDEIGLFRVISKIPKVGGIYRIATRNLPYCDRVLGHMIGFICRKIEQVKNH